MMVVWAANTDKFQKLLGFDFVLPPPTSLPLDSAPGRPSIDDPTSKAFSKWDKSVDDDTELMKTGVVIREAGQDGWGVVCEGGEVCWRAMVTTHWPKLLQHYGFPTKNR